MSVTQHYLALYGQTVCRAASSEPPVSIKSGFDVNRVAEAIELNYRLREASNPRDVGMIEQRLDAIMLNEAIACTFGLGFDLYEDKWPADDLAIAIQMIGIEIDHWNEALQQDTTLDNLRQTPAGWITNVEHLVNVNNQLRDYVCKNLVRDSGRLQTKKSWWPSQLWFSVASDEFVGWGWTTAPRDVLVQLLTGK